MTAVTFHRDLQLSIFAKCLKRVQGEESEAAADKKLAKGKDVLWEPQ